MKKQNQSRIADFRNEVYSYFNEHGRQLPWRETSDPYHILLSEIMLQQTQVSRVAGKFTVFIEAFPTVESLNEAEQKDVLALWSGLGYNRRALSLKKAAGIIVDTYGGKVPDDIGELRTLPGIGQATAAAICAYAFNRPVIYIETNIRTVFIHHFFPDREQVPDSDILPLVEQTLDTDNPRRWYSALMDYGVMLKAANPNPGRRSAHHTKQSKFEGSDRQIRGAILRLLTDWDGVMPEDRLIDITGADKKRCLKIIARLETEGFLSREGTKLSLK